MRDALTLQVPFACEPIEQHPLEEFQEVGHFVCAMVDEHGRRREWVGDQVYVLKLLFKGEQVLRIMADSETEANRLMTAAIRDTFYANWTAQFIVGFNHAEWTKLNDRRNQLAEWLKWRGFLSMASDKDIFDAIVSYLRAYRKLINAPETTDKPSEWIPQEWRG